MSRKRLRHMLPPNVPFGPSKYIIPTHQSTPHGLWNMHLISNASHFIRQLIHIHRIHLIHYASMLHHLNWQLLPSHSSIMHPSQSITALPRHQHHHMPSFSTSQPHPSHVHCHHSSNSPTTPSTPSKPVQTSPAPPARSNGNPKTSSAPASSQKTFNKHTTRSKLSWAAEPVSDPYKAYTTRYVPKSGYEQYLNTLFPAWNLLQ